METYSVEVKEVSDIREQTYTQMVRLVSQI